jgi:RNAse (barnase) inhibitor barstar
MIVRIDARRLNDTHALLSVIREAMGLAATTSRNLDAVIDCLTDLDNPGAGMSHLQVFPGQIVLVAIDNAADLSKQQEVQLNALVEMIAFVNWRRLEKTQPPVLSIAYTRR